MKTRTVVLIYALFFPTYSVITAIYTPSTVMTLIVAAMGVLFGAILAMAVVSQKREQERPPEPPPPPRPTNGEHKNFVPASPPQSGQPTTGKWFEL